MGFAMSFLIKINWGFDPGSFMNKSISLFIGLSFGTWCVILYGIMLVFVFIFDRNLIGVGTIVNMVLLGYSADFFGWLGTKIISPALWTDSQYVAIKVAIFILSMIVFIVGAAVYMKCNIGIAPYDAIPMIIHKKLFSRISFAFVRMTYDMTVVVVGVAFCVKNNPALMHSFPGAFLIALLAGPIITFVGNWLEKKFSLFSKT